MLGHYKERGKVWLVKLQLRDLCSWFLLLSLSFLAYKNLFFMPLDVRFLYKQDGVFFIHSNNQTLGKGPGDSPGRGVLTWKDNGLVETE